MIKAQSNLLHFEKNIWTVFTVVALLFISLSSLLSWKSYENEVDAATAFSKNTSLAISEKVTRIFSSAEDVLNNVSSEIIREKFQQKHNERQLHLLLRSYLARTPAISEYYFSDKDGNVFASSLEYPLRNHSQKDHISPLEIEPKDHSPASYEEPAMLIGELSTSKNGDVLIPVTRKVEDANHQYLGTLGGYIRVEAFREFNSEYSNFESMSFAVVHPNGTIIVRYPYNKVFLGKKALLAQQWAKEGFSAPSGTAEIKSGFDGKNRIIAYRKVEGFPLYANTAVTKEEIFSNWLPHLFTQLALTIAILIVGWLGALFLKRSLHTLDFERSETVNSYTELCDLLQKTNAKMGSAYFEALVLNFSKAFHVDQVFVAELTREQPATARTISLYSHHRFDQPLEYLLENTPCHRVMGQEVCFFDQNVQHVFPKDLQLQMMDIQCYLGVPLKDSDGKAIGILVAMHTTPRPDLERALGLFQLFGDRAGAELERLKKEKQQRDSAAS